MWQLKPETYLHIYTVSKQNKWIKVELWGRRISKYSGLKTFLLKMTCSSCQACCLQKENKSVNDFQKILKNAKPMPATDWNLTLLWIKPMTDTGCWLMLTLAVACLISKKAFFLSIVKCFFFLVIARYLIRILTSQLGLEKITPQFTIETFREAKCNLFRLDIQWSW